MRLALGMGKLILACLFRATRVVLLAYERAWRLGCASNCLPMVRAGSNTPTDGTTAPLPD